VSIRETRRPTIPVEPGQPQHDDSEYERLGTVVSFMMTEISGGWCKVPVRATKAAIDLTKEI
jgi:hypothetical protein